MDGKSQRKKPSRKWRRDLESKRKSKKRTSLGQIHQADKSGNLIYGTNASEVSSNVSLNNSKNGNELASKEGLKFFYTNADQFVNKREGLLILIAEDKPGVILITEVIPKSQVSPCDYMDSFGNRWIETSIELRSGRFESRCIWYKRGSNLF